MKNSHCKSKIQLNYLKLNDYILLLYYLSLTFDFVEEIV